jgi:opacity protein-like surface antigen
MHIGRSLAFLSLLGLLAPRPAAADGYVVPFVGANFGGDVGRPLNAAVRDRNRAAVGATLGAMGGGIFGIELDMSYTRSFYPTTGSPAASNNLVTVVPALVIGVPIGGQRGPGLRPFALAGAGLVRRNFDFGSVASVSQNDLAYTLGGGVMGFLSDHLGIRGDIRHVRNFRVDDLSLTGINLERGTFNFSRATAGLIIRF